jgi:nucleoside-diphosphate-sugar epimerase
MSLFKRLTPIDAVIHLAAVADVQADWNSVLHINIDGTQNVYEAARQTQVKRIVFASSNHVTGVYEGIPPQRHLTRSEELIHIGMAPRPDSYYGISKLTGEGIASYYFDYFGIESVCLRIGTVLESDNPTQDPRHRSTWLSHHDILELVRKSLTVKEQFTGFGVYYGVSSNRHRFWDIQNARDELGYQPKDDASELV